uniref:Uncharacterized protein n=1 Tax=mine drainage metagenome TaxID=410659 RepID=E6PZ41_9ZZZZ
MYNFSRRHLGAFVITFVQDGGLLRELYAREDLISGENFPLSWSFRRGFVSSEQFCWK